MGSPGEEIEILLVEDNEGDIRLFEETLKEGKVCNNLKVIKDGKKASDYLEKKEKVKPHIVFLDINLPSLSGIEVLKVLKKEETLKGVTTAILSTCDEESLLEEMGDVKPDIYLKKPLTVKTLSEAIVKIDNFFIEIVKKKEVSL